MKELMSSTEVALLLGPAVSKFLNDRDVAIYALGVTLLSFDFKYFFLSLLPKNSITKTFLRNRNASFDSLLFC